MKWKGLTIKLQLAYPPVSNYDFTHVRTEREVQQWLHDSMIYMIVQRPVMTFDHVRILDNAMEFEISQKGKEETLFCCLPVRQRALMDDPEGDLGLEMGWHDVAVTEETMLSGLNIDAFKFYTNGEFSAWLTPERFLYEWGHGNIDAKVNGNTRIFANYHVHYVGKATDQPIWNRLDGHKTLQKILSVVRPHASNLPTHELGLLLFRVEDVLSVSIYDLKESIDLKTELPDKKEISLDAEKLLVRSLAPEFNDPKKRFPNYPMSKDGLFSYRFNRYAYQIVDELALSNGHVVIQGSLDTSKADILAIDNNQNIEILELVKW